MNCTICFSTLSTAVTLFHFLGKTSPVKKGKSQTDTLVLWWSFQKQPDTTNQLHFWMYTKIISIVNIGYPIVNLRCTTPLLRRFCYVNKLHVFWKSNLIFTYGSCHTINQRNVYSIFLTYFYASFPLIISLVFRVCVRYLNSYEKPD